MSPASGSRLENHHEHTRSRPRSDRRPASGLPLKARKSSWRSPALMMFLFVIGHMLGNLQMFEGPRTHQRLRPLPAQPGRAALDRARHPAARHRAAHHRHRAACAAQQAARPHRLLAQAEAINSSYASRTMYWSGPIVLAFIIFHLLQFTAGYVHPDADLHRRRCLPQRRLRLPGLVGFRSGTSSRWACSACTSATASGACSSRVGLAPSATHAHAKKAARSSPSSSSWATSPFPISVLLGFVK